MPDPSERLMGRIHKFSAKRETEPVRVSQIDYTFTKIHKTLIKWHAQLITVVIGFAVRADFRRLYPANAKTPMCCPSDDNRTKVTNSVTSARSLWWHVGPYFWNADLTRTANPISLTG